MEDSRRRRDDDFGDRKQDDQETMIVKVTWLPLSMLVSIDVEYSHVFSYLS